MTYGMTMVYISSIWALAIHEHVSPIVSGNIDEPTKPTTYVVTQYIGHRYVSLIEPISTLWKKRDNTHYAIWCGNAYLVLKYGSACIIM